jgi:hypothetical protein
LLLRLTPRIVFELQKNEPKSLKNLDLAQNRTPASRRAKSFARQRFATLAQTEL